MNKDAKNLPEFKALIERYETITLEEIEIVFDKYGSKEESKESLTGFGLNCSLCVVAGIKKELGTMRCYSCVYGAILDCQRQETFKAIYNATTPKSLLSAYRARAKYMRTLLKEIDHA